ncbi:hypothetical protein ACFL1V_09165, partial [Pseudomonadota bacterium]
MSPIKIIHESEVNASPALLEKSWSDFSTFIFIPDKGVSSDWLSKITGLIPAEYYKDCFGLLTSGSTGEPKLILGNKERSESLVRVLNELQGSEPVSETVCILPFTYSYAFINQWLWAKVFNKSLRLTRGFSEPDHLKETLSQSR